MKTYRMVSWQQSPEFRDEPVPDPAAGQVLLKIGGAGVCHSDLHVMDVPAGILPYEPSFTLGHENAGWVEKIGRGVEGFSAGDAVAVYGPWGCGHCYPCCLGAENCCEQAGIINGGAAGGGLGLDGGMAEYMLVPNARYLVPLRNLTPREAAPFTDAALTPYHAIKRVLSSLTPRASAIVIGIGGLGHLAIQILRVLTSSQIIAMDLNESKLKFATEVGADVTVHSDEEAPAKIAELTHGLGAEVVLDMVGSDETMSLAAKMSRKTGHVVVIGMALGSLPFNAFSIQPECTFSMPYWGSLPELIEIIALAERCRIKSHNTYFSLDEAPEVYAALRNGALKGRAVIVPA